MYILYYVSGVLYNKTFYNFICIYCICCTAIVYSIVKTYLKIGVHVDVLYIQAFVL